MSFRKARIIGSIPKTAYYCQTQGPGVLSRGSSGRDLSGAFVAAKAAGGIHPPAWPQKGHSCTFRASGTFGHGQGSDGSDEHTVLFGFGVPGQWLWRDKVSLLGARVGVGSQIWDRFSSAPTCIAKRKFAEMHRREGVSLYLGLKTLDPKRLSRKFISRRQPHGCTP